MSRICRGLVRVLGKANQICALPSKRYQLVVFPTVTKKILHAASRQLKHANVCGFFETVLVCKRAIRRPSRHDQHHA